MSRAVALLALVAALAVVPAAASAATARASFNDVENALMCDTCNVPLNIAQSGRADQERQEIRDLIARGLTKQQILDRFRTEYGPNVIAKPEGGGAAFASWAVPIALLAAALAGIALLLPRWRRRRSAGAGAPALGPELSTADSNRLEQDLATYDL